VFGGVGAVEEGVGVRSEASKGVHCEGQEEDFVVKECLKILRVVDELGAGELHSQGVQVGLGNRVLFWGRPCRGCGMRV
jgi:hypothetical protein